MAEDYDSVVFWIRHIEDDCKELRRVLDADIIKKTFSRPRYDSNKPSFVYLISTADKTKVKIGVSDNPEERKSTLQTASGSALKIDHLILFKDRSDAFSAESFLKKHYKSQHIRGEWFEPEVLSDVIKNFYDRSCFEFVEE